MRKRAKPTEPYDYGTSEIAKRLTVIPKLYGNYLYHAKVMDETEIDRMLLRDEINPEQHSVLEAFLRRLQSANFGMVSAINLEAPGGTDPSRIGDRKAASLVRVVNLFRDMDKKIGPAFRRSLVDLVLHDTEWKHGLPDLRSSISSLKQLLLDGPSPVPASEAD